MNSIKNIFLKYRTKIIAVVSLLLIASALVQLYFVLVVRVTSNDECLWIPKKVSSDSVAIYFDVVKVDGVTWNAGIRNGDQLLEIDGKVLYGTFQAQQILNGFSSGDYADYKVVRAGNILNTKVYVKKLVQFGNLASSLSSLFWILIGFIVLTAKPDGRIHKLFYFIGVLTVLASMHTLLDYFKFFNDFGFLSVLIGCLTLIGLSYLPFILNYFFWNFPTQLKFAEKKWVKKIIIILPAFISVLAILSAALALNGIIGQMILIQGIESLGYFAIFANITVHGSHL